MSILRLLPYFTIISSRSRNIWFRSDLDVAVQDDVYIEHDSVGFGGTKMVITTVTSQWGACNTTAPIEAIRFVIHGKKVSQETSVNMQQES